MARARRQSEQDNVDRFIESIREELPQLDLEVEAIVDRIRGLARRLRRDHDETLGEIGLNWGEFGLLGMLKSAGPPYRRSPGQLAKFGDLSSGAMTNRLDRLEERGLIRRLPDPNDRRALHIELTEPGAEVYLRAVDAQAGKEQHVTASLTAAEKRQLNDLLRKLMLEYERRDGTSDEK